MRILLVDASNAAARSQHVFKEAQTPDGFYTGAIYGTVKEILVMMATSEFDAVVACLDSGIPKFRLEVCPEYKQQRAEKRTKEDEEQRARYKAQLEVLHDVLVPAGVTCIRSPGWEADDVIAALAVSRLKEHECVIFSADKDFITLLDNQGRVTAYSPCTKDYLEPDPFYLLKRLMDPKSSDNLDGVTGIGKVKADKLIEAWQGATDYDGPGHAKEAMEDFLKWCREGEAPDPKMDKLRNAVYAQEGKVRANWFCTNLYRNVKECRKAFKFRKGKLDRKALHTQLNRYALKPLIEDFSVVWSSYSRLKPFPELPK